MKAHFMCQGAEIRKHKISLSDHDMASRWKYFVERNVITLRISYVVITAEEYFGWVNNFCSLTAVHNYVLVALKCQLKHFFIPLKRIYLERVGNL